MTPRTVALHRIVAGIIALVAAFGAANYYLELGIISPHSGKGVLVFALAVMGVWWAYFEPKVPEFIKHQRGVDRKLALRQSYEKLRSVQSLPLAERVGNLVEYERLLAEHAERAVRGQAIDPRELPEPDEVALRRIAAIKANDQRTPAEEALLGHFYLLHDLRSALADEATDPH